MANKRVERLNEQLKREIAEIVRTEVRDPRIGLPTVTEVEVTPDLWMARVYVRPDPAQGEDDDLMEGLRAAAPFIRRELGKVLRVRRVPELRFEEDRTLEQALRIERILGEVRPQDEGEEK
jgi:ribosome-binding factor A